VRFTKKISAASHYGFSGGRFAFGNAAEKPVFPLPYRSPRLFVTTHLEKVDEGCSVGSFIGIVVGNAKPSGQIEPPFNEILTHIQIPTRRQIVKLITL
jgi:hypothetical protein